MHIDYYIYYRIETGQHEALSETLETMQASLQAATGVAGRFRRRVDDPLTWMEIYEGVSNQRLFELELGCHVQQYGLHTYLAAPGVRHLERFRAP